MLDSMNLPNSRAPNGAPPTRMSSPAGRLNSPTLLQTVAVKLHLRSSGDVDYLDAAHYEVDLGPLANLLVMAKMFRFHAEIYNASEYFKWCMSLSPSTMGTNWGAKVAAMIAHEAIQGNSDYRSEYFLVDDSPGAVGLTNRLFVSCFNKEGNTEIQMAELTIVIEVVFRT